jgi:type I restriction enzyme S subunit
VSFPKYQTYKDSGIDWIGEVPNHWDVEPLKVSYAVVAGATPKTDVAEYWDGEIPWVTPADLGKTKTLEIGATARTISLEGLASCAASLVPVGSVILSTRAPIGSLGIANTPVTTNQGCKALVARQDAKPGFLLYVLSAATAALNVRGKGTTFLELSGDELASFRVPTPTAEEQGSIAAFLDRETAGIDALIEEQERLIALLKEKRQAVISHAVTKGLDPTAPMKDSGVGWLGEVPAHWEVLPLKHAVRLRSGEAITSDTINDAGDFPVFGGNGLRGFTDEYTHDGDYVLVGRQGALCGNINYASGKFWASEHAIVATPSRPVVTRWLGELLRVMNLGQYSTSAAQPGLAAEVLGNLRCPYPPPSEQALIAALLDREIEFSEGLMAEAQAAVTLLQERRSALISAAVTGKIDVSDAHSTSVETEGFSHADL